MRRILLLISLFFSSLLAYSQSKMDVKLGIGVSNLGTGDKLIGKLEGEVTKKWNRILSNSFLLGVGYGDFYSRKIPQPTNDPNNIFYRKREFSPSFVLHLDANLFASPFGNDKINNLKIGTGISVMYVYDDIEESYETYQRISMGMSAIIENEISIGQKYLLGLKAMLQPYLNGDINISLMLKFGKKL